MKKLQQVAKCFQMKQRGCNRGAEDRDLISKPGMSICRLFRGSVGICLSCHRRSRRRASGGSTPPPTPLIGHMLGTMVMPSNEINSLVRMHGMVFRRVTAASAIWSRVKSSARSRCQID
jgi:hypothetical protein